MSTIKTNMYTPGHGIDKSNFALSHKEFITETQSSIHCAMVNCRSIVNKNQTNQVEIATHNIDLCALIETWIKQENTTILTCCPSIYKAFSMPRLNKTGGGIAIIYKERLKISEKQHLSIHNDRMH